MSWKYFDFECPKCEEIFEDMVDGKPMITECIHCGFRAAKRMNCAPKLGFMNDPTKRAETLKKRSEAHTASEQKKGNLPTADTYAEFRGKK